MRALLAWEHFDAEHDWRSEIAPDANGAQITTLLGPELSAPAPFTEAIPSWGAQTPAGSWVEVQLRTRRSDGRWTSFYRIAQWDSLDAGSVRRSFASQRDDDGRVATDTLMLAAPAEAIQARLLLYASAGPASPKLRSLRLALSTPDARPAPALAFTPRELPIPPRAQLSYPNGSVICSPTAVTMLLAYWQARTGDPQLAPFAEHAAVAEIVAPRVYDPVYEGYGNWGFNTAFAASCGLDAYVARLAGLAQLDAWIDAGVPVVISAAWKDGELTNAPIASSSGHLLIVAGFDQGGRVIVADPRGDSEREVRRLYDAAQLQAAWQNNSDGAVYLIHPHKWPIPSFPFD